MISCEDYLICFELFSFSFLPLLSFLILYFLPHTHLSVLSSFFICLFSFLRSYRFLPCGYCLIFSGLKRPLCEADRYLPSSSTEVISVWSCTSTSLYICMLWSLSTGKKFNFIYFYILPCRNQSGAFKPHLAKRKIDSIRFVMLLCPSVCSHIKTRESMDCFSLNFILGSCTQISVHVPILLKSDKSNVHFA